MNGNIQKISVIVPVYRGQQYIRNIIKMLEFNWITLNAICDTEMQLILVNDYPDVELFIDTDWVKNVHVRILETGINQRIHGARITGLKTAEGEYLLFLDQDDEIADHYFVSQLNNLGMAGAVLCNGIYRKSTRIYSNEDEQRKAIIKDEYLNTLNRIISPGQVLLRKAAIPREWYEHALHENGSDDVLLWILMLKNKEIFSVNTDCLFVHNEDGNNASLDFQKMHQSVTELKTYIKELNILNTEEFLLFENGANDRLDKYKRYIEILNKMDTITNNTQKYMKEHNYKEIAIYGMGVIGEKYIGELEKLGIKIAYGIDKKRDSMIDKKIRILNLNEELDPVDLIIVTATFAYENIEKDIKSKVVYPVISLDYFL